MSLMKVLSLFSLMFFVDAFASDGFSNFKVSIDKDSSYYNQVISVRFKYNCLMHGSADNWHLAEIKGNNLFGSDHNLNCKSQPGYSSHLLKKIEIKMILNNSNEKLLTVNGHGQHWDSHPMKNGEQIDCYISNGDQLFCSI